MITKEIVDSAMLELYKERDIELYEIDYGHINYSFLYFLYIKLFNHLPLIGTIGSKIIKIQLDDAEKEKDKNERISYSKTIANIYKSRPNCITYENACGYFIVDENFIMCGSVILINSEEEFNKLSKFIINKDITKSYINWIITSNNGFTTKHREIKDVIFDKKNYNNDLPIEKICEELENNNSTLMLFHGAPGTGKTTFIRSLISKYKDKSFYYIDGKSLGNYESEELANLLIGCKDGIFIIEDCEMLLASRDGGNSALSTILNITDGMLGDSLGLKFICTFNTNVENLDKALIRKGRLKLKYEFKKLTKDKVKVLFDELGILETPEEMPICDIYNYLIDNGINKQKKIGF